MKTDFEIPIDVKNDLVYCQRALTNHILIHQKLLSTCAHMKKPTDAKALESLKSLERIIIDIGNEQKLLFNRLRFSIDFHQISKGVRLAERERLNKMIGDELLNCISNSGDIRPTNVTRRLSEDALHAKYLKHDDSADGDSSNHSSSNSVSDEIKLEPNSGSDDEPIEMSVQPDDMRLVYTGPRQKPSKPPTVFIKANGPSLLKPMSERKIGQCEQDPPNIPVVRPEVGIKKVKEPTQVTVQPSASDQVRFSRLRLKEALCKAKDTNKAQLTVQPTQNNVQKKTPETAPLTVTIKCNTPSLSSSRSSDASSSGEVEFLKDEENPVELGKETFLRMFGLYTPAYTEHLMNRRPQRKRRQCTSTERGDFHYGKFELFERQFAKRNKQFLYSPPATRAKRRIGSNGTIIQPRDPVIMPKRARGIKSNASSSSSLSSNGSNNGSESQRVCLTCYKRNNLLQCQVCCGKYHAGCHMSSVKELTRKQFCPICVRPRINANLKTYIAV